ncbi:MAG: hypothetical protein Q4D29_10170 [Lachnospiraceae bacterium]|nr:hypothetical protein [Lachnospiraceae bacterium]
MEQKYYVYEWFNVDTGEVFYVGKGCRDRYKSLSHRNKLFLEYYKNNNVDVRIVKYFEIEDDAYQYEKELTDNYRKINQCKCCLIDGGYGGYSSIWSEEARKYKSENNPMKEEHQRKRMSVNNPMKNPDVAKKVGDKERRYVCIGENIYWGWKEAASAFGLTPNSVGWWLKKGYAPNGEPCYYIEKNTPDKKVM